MAAPTQQMYNMYKCALLGKQLVVYLDTLKIVVYSYIAHTMHAAPQLKDCETHMSKRYE